MAGAVAVRRPVDRSRLTLRGRIVLVAAAGMGLVAYLFGLQELYCVAAGAAVLVAVSWGWVAGRRWQLEMVRLVHPTRVTAGHEARVELTARNRAGQPTPPVEGRDPFDGGKRWARFAIAPLAPAEVRRSSYRLPSNRRGVYHLGPLELHLRDPFGLAERVRLTAAHTSLTVHPRYDLVAIRAASAHREEDRRLSQPVLGKGGNEFYALREYVPGDDLRHVHWPTTARLDHLVIRQPENLQRGRVTVAADLRTGVADEHLEAVVSAAASITVSALRAGLQVRLVTTAGFDSGHGTGGTHASLVLDGLAAAAAHRPIPGVAPFRTVTGGDPVVVVTTGRCSDEDVRSVFASTGTASTTVVVFETAYLDSEAALSRVQKTVRVPVGGSFASAWTLWERAMA